MRIGSKELAAADIAARIDHTVLSPAAGRTDMEKACGLARRYGFRAVFTNPFWSPTVAELLEGSGIRAGISAAFPLGSLSTNCKVREVMTTVEELAGRPCEVDMVANLGLLKEGHHAAYTEDMAAVVRALRGMDIAVKAIVETSLLTDEEIRVACLCAAEAGVQYAKTSTGRNGPPKLSDIRVMRAALPPETGIKFSGFGTHNAPELAAWALLLGADLLGSPAGDVLVDALTDDYAAISLG